MPPRRTAAGVADSAEMAWEDIDLAPITRVPFPIEVFPDHLRDYVSCVADAARVTLDAPALLTLGAISAAAANRFHVRVGSERHGVHLWVLATMLSGRGKSITLDWVFAPFRVAQESLRAVAAERELERRVDRRVARAQQGALIRRLAALPAGNPDIAAERADVRRQLLALEGESERLRDVAEPTLLVDDTSVPALIQALAAQDGTLTMLSAEGSSFFSAISGAAACEPIEPLLQAYSGEAIRVNRVSRPSLTIERPALAVMLATQPHVVRRRLRSGFAEGRGLWERFLCMEPELRLPTGIDGSPSADRLSISMYSSTISSLLAFSTKAPQELRLSPAAQDLLRQYSADIETRMTTGDLSEPHIQGWAYRVRGNTIRIAANLHLAAASTEDLTVTRTEVENAIRVMTCCISQAQYVLGAATDPSDTRAIVDWVRTRRVQSVSARDLRRALHRTFPEARLLQAALDDLEARGIVRLRENRGPVGRPSSTVAFHPKLLGTAAERDSGSAGAKTPEPAREETTVEVSAFRHQASPPVNVPGRASLPSPAVPSTHGCEPGTDPPRRSADSRAGNDDESAPPNVATVASSEPPKSVPVTSSQLRGAEAARVHLPLADAYGREVDDHFVRREIERGAWRPFVVAPEVSGLTREMTIMLATRKTDLIKWDFHGDKDTFCPPIWADFAIGSGACGFGCRSCFLMLTFRAMRDPLSPVVYDNGDDFERAARKWLSATHWDVDYGTKDRRRRARTHKDSIGLGIDCSDSLLMEGVTGHARRLIPVFTDPRSNPLGNPLILLTKSANTHYLAQLKDSELRRVNGRIPTVSITMSVNPEGIADLWEGKYPDTLERITPPISRRLEALRFAQDLGFDVRLRVDPIMTPPGWEEQYTDFFDHMAHRYGLRPSMITLGSHREKNATLDKFRAFWGLPEMEWEAETTAHREGTHHHMVGREDVYRRVRDMIVSAFKGTGCQPWISLCKETHAVRRDTELLSANCNCLPQTDAGKRHLAIYREPSALPATSSSPECDGDGDACVAAEQETVERTNPAHADGGK